ncbi:MAG: carbon starvation protein A, partial [Acidobacteria bacterium]|nr:carbon starvation protein A [Acidobacteriota bacterium]
MKKIARAIFWIAFSLLGAAALSAIALERDEPLNATWFVIAAGCSYIVGYRFYSAFIAARVLALDESRATPAERLDNGRDFVPTNKWVLMGHHFASIAGPGPLVGPTLAAQFGYLPGTLWLVIGAVVGGAVQDFVVLFGSVRRDGKSLGQIAREEVNRPTGLVALFAILSILIILLAVVGLVVTNALKNSAWATFTIAASMPVAMLMGLYLRFWRPGRVLEATALGLTGILFAVVAGEWVAQSPTWAASFTWPAMTLALAIILYGFAASALPVWLLLAPRDYLSTFIKLAVTFALAAGIVFARPDIQMPAFTRFVDGTGPIFGGKIFPFCFITIACGAISGFHSLISSGTTPKMITQETHARMIGYGSMLLESLVGVMAMIAACVLQPGVYFAINSPAGIVGATAEQAATTISGWGFPLEAGTMTQLASDVGEQTLLNRTGGAPALAVGMAHIFSSTLGGARLMGIWYHFAIMFEAVFILTVLDTGTRVARYMLQDFLGHFWKPLGRTSWYPSVLATSALICGAWGYFLYAGVRDPLGGINTLWPLFGISNQLLASVALVVMTTILLKMGQKRYLWVTLAPTAWLVAVTMTASWQKAFHPDPGIGFLAQARQLADGLAAGAVPAAQVAEVQRLIFNNRLDAVVTLVLASLVLVVIVSAAWEWYRIWSGQKKAVLHETP